MNGEFDFVKLHFDLSQSFYLQNVGTTAYNVQAGWINGALPYVLLFEGIGSFHKDIPFVMKNFFLNNFNIMKTKKSTKRGSNTL